MDRFIKILRIILVLFIFSWLVIWFSLRAGNKDVVSRNWADEAVVFLSKAPRQVKEYFKNVNSTEHLEKFVAPNDNLYRLGELLDNSYLDESHYLLHYRYKGGDRGVVLLQNINNGELVYTWEIPLIKIMEDIKSIEKEISDDHKNGKFTPDITDFILKNHTVIRAKSPIMLADTSLLFHCILGYLYKIDKNSKIVWKSDKYVHHSIELDSQGNIWTCSKDMENEFANKHVFWDDAILCLDPNGKERHFYSLTDIFRNNNVFEELINSSASMATMRGVLDPFHLNDVQPVNEDGTYWKKGDVFLSMRNQSMVALYRPDTDSIIWQQKGPWIVQHDVNIINDSVISIFNNNYGFFERADFSSNIAYYNFANGETTYLGKEVFASPTNGRQTRTINNDYIIEETDKSRYHVLDSTGALKNMFYIPYHTDNSKAHYPAWARVYVKKDNQFIMQ